MNKLFLAAVAFTFVGYASANTLNAPIAATEDSTVVAQQDKRTPVKLEELPEAVKKTLASDTYTGWTAASAVWVDAKISYYEIQLVKGEEKNVAKLSKEGTPIA